MLGGGEIGVDKEVKMGFLDRVTRLFSQSSASSDGREQMGFSSAFTRHDTNRGIDLTPEEKRLVALTQYKRAAKEISSRTGLSHKEAQLLVDSFADGTHEVPAEYEWPGHPGKVALTDEEMALIRAQDWQQAILDCHQRTGVHMQIVAESAVLYSSEF